MFQESLPKPSSLSLAPSPRRLARAVTGGMGRLEIDNILQRVLDQCVTTELLSPFFEFVHHLLIVFLPSTEL
jgi:hypothetical protein